MTSLGKNLLFACLIGSLLAGCGSSEAPNEQNRFYLRGRKHVQANEPDKAVTAFRECLRRSPGSHKAHLELGMLSEDHLHDLNGAILHYRAFLKVSVDDQKNAAVRLWLNRVERDLLRELRLIYEGPELPRVARPASRPSTVPTAPRPRSSARPPAAIEPPVIVLGTPGSTPSRTTTLAPQVTAPPPNQPEKAFRWYTVKGGDSLARIAKKELGSEKFWGVIYNMNRDILPNESRVGVGQRLRIPTD